MKKQGIIIAMLIFCIPLSMQASGSELLEAMKTGFQGSIADYQNLGNCKPTNNRTPFDIKGIENGKCHYVLMNQNCYAPMSSMKEYSSKMIAETNRLISEINKGRLDVSAEPDFSPIKGAVCK